MSYWLSHRTRLAAAAALCALAPLAACGDAGPTTGGTARLSILLTDAPGDFAHAVVTISEIYLQGDGGRVVLMNAPVTTDLLTLANSTASLVQDAVVPPGRYGELRFVVTGGYVEVEQAGGGSKIYASSPSYAGLPQGATVDGTLRMPSLGQSGLKVKLPGDGLSLETEQKVMLVDFDVAGSFGHEAGNSGAWVMHPVLAATEIQASAGIAVSVSKDAALVMPTVGAAALGLGDLRVVLTNADGAHEEMALSDVDGNGVFEAHFGYVLPGAWSLDLVGPAGVSLVTTETRPVAVSLAAGGESSTAFTLTGATYVPPTP